MTVIAIEEHWTTPELQDAQGALTGDRRDASLALNEHGDAFERLTDLASRRLETMDEQGVDVQILSLAPPGAGVLDPDAAREHSRTANDLAAAAQRAHPERFRWLATLPLTDPTAVADELTRSVGAGAVGAMVYGRTGARPLDDPAYDELLAAAARLEVPLFLHPQIPSAATQAASYGGFPESVELALSTFSWGWHLEAATAALRLIASGAFDRHPTLQLVLGHWGELLPFWHSRLGGLSAMAGLERPASEVLRENVHLTASGMLEPALLHHALAVTSVDRILFSTDYPFQKPTGEAITRFAEELSPGDREAFLSGNARRLFRV